MGRVAETIKTTQATSGRVYTCKIDSICDDDDDRSSVAALMATDSLSARSIARTLGVSEGSVFKHRSKHCQCYRANA